MYVKYIYTRDVNKVHGLFNALFCFVPIASSIPIPSAYLCYTLIYIENLEYCPTQEVVGSFLLAFGEAVI